MGEYRFTLEKYKGKREKRTCPNCEKEHEFSRYIDNETGEPLADHVGRCDNENKCGYHYPPREYFKSNPGLAPVDSFRHKSTEKKEVPLFHIPFDEMATTRTGWGYNTFFNYLVELFGPDEAYDLIQEYPVGTITGTHYAGACVFWFVTATGSIRAGQVKLFDKTGHTAKFKNGDKCTNWIHSLLEQHCKKNNLPLPNWIAPYIEQPKRVTCLYGEHLLAKSPNAPVAVVEAPKTAIIASKYYPNFIWVAAGAKGWLTFDRCQSLRGRDVTLFPDLGAFEDWSNRAKALSSIVRSIKVDETLEKVATLEQVKAGLDLADYLVNFDTQMF
jgi:hypothetical protein